jgi:H+/gluconate symporter-like permease
VSLLLVSADGALAAGVRVAKIVQQMETGMGNVPAHMAPIVGPGATASATATDAVAVASAAHSLCGHRITQPVRIRVNPSTSCRRPGRRGMD